MGLISELKIGDTIKSRFAQSKVVCIKEGGFIYES